MTVISLVTASMLASADRTLLKEDLAASAAVNVDGDLQNGSFVKFASSLFQTSGSGYEHVWPVSSFTCLRLYHEGYLIIDYSLYCDLINYKTLMTKTASIWTHHCFEPVHATICS